MTKKIESAMFPERFSLGESLAAPIQQNIVMKLIRKGRPTNESTNESG